MSENNNAIQNVQGDGRALPVSSDELSQLKSDLTQIASQANIFMQQRNEDGAIRFCEWDGRSSDGRKYASRTNKIPPLFDGQPDAQIFLTDTAVRIKSAELCQAAKRMNVTFEPSSRDDDAEAGARICEARYLWARRRMGSAYLNEQRRAANWYLDGTPAGVVWFAGWKRLTQLRMKRMTVDEAAVSILKNYFEQQDGGPVQEPSPADLELMRSYLTVNEPEVITAAVELLTTALGIEATTARFVLKQFQEDGEAEFPEPYQCANEPILMALEPWADVFWNVNTVRDIQNARDVHMREWLTAAQVMERALKNGWSDEFVDQLLGKPEEQSAQTGGGQAGKSGLPIPWGTIYQAQTPLSQQLGIYKDFRHLYEVITTFSKGMNKFGVPGIYVTEWSYFIEEAACEKKLFESGHDTMPFRYGQRECVNLSTTDSRGTTFAGTSAQNLLKMYTDLHGAAAQLSTVPPFTVPDSALDGEIIISPLAQNKMARGRTIDPIKFPEAQANLEAQRIVERRFNRHVGLLDEDVNANETMVVTQEEIDNFLNPLRDAWSMVLADMDVFLDEDQKEEIDGDDYGRQAGEMHIEMAFDALELDREALMELTDVVLDKLMVADVEQTIPRGDTIRWLLSKWSPGLARLCRPVNDANARENAAADDDLNKLMNGISVPMQEKGINHEQRYNRIMARLQQPEVAVRVAQSPDQGMPIEKHLAFLKQQMVQRQNVATGRFGVAPDALQQDAATMN